MGAITILSFLSFGLFLVAGTFFNLWQREKLRADAAERTLNATMAQLETAYYENGELLRQKQAGWDGSKPRPVYPGNRVLNSAQARKAMERDNADFFSADRKVPNSEVLKEQSNG